MIIGMGVYVHPDYATLQRKVVTDAVVRPGYAQRVKEAALVRNLDSYARQWGKFAFFYLFVNDSGGEAYGLYNWKDPNNFEIIKTGTVTYTSMAGVQGNGSTGVYDTDFNPDPDGGANMIAGGSSYLYWCLGNATTGVHFGANNGATGGYTYVNASTMLTRINNASTATPNNVAGPTSPGVGKWLFIRADNNFIEIWKDGAFDKSVEVPVDAETQQPIQIFARRNGLVVGNFADNTVGLLAGAGVITEPLKTTQSLQIFNGESIELGGVTYEMMSVPALDVIEADYGTAYGSLTLPSTVDVLFDNDELISIAVTWAAGSYDGNTPGTYVLIGTLATSAIYLNSEGIEARQQVFVNSVEPPSTLGFALRTDQFQSVLSNRLATIEVEDFLNNWDFEDITTSPIMTLVGSRYFWNCEASGNMFRSKSVGLGAAIIGSGGLGFTLAFRFKPFDGQPASSYCLFHDTADTSNPLTTFFSVTLATNGRVAATVCIGGTSVVTSPNTVNFGNGTVTEQSIVFTFTNGELGRVYKDKVIQTLVAGQGILSTINLASYNNTTNYLSIGRRRTGAASFDLNMPVNCMLADIVMQPVVWNQNQIDAYHDRPATTKVIPQTFEIVECGDTETIFSDNLASTRIATGGIGSHLYYPTTFMEGTDTLHCYMDRDNATQLCTAKVIKISSAGTVTGPFTMGTPDIRDHHETPALVKWNSKWYCFQENNHDDNGINVYRSNTDDVADGFEVSKLYKIGSDGAYPKVLWLPLVSKWMLLTRDDDKIIGCWTSDDLDDSGSWVYNQLAVFTSGSLEQFYSWTFFKSENGSEVYFGGVRRHTNTSPFPDLNSYVFKTSDGVNISNVAGTFSQDISVAPIGNASLTTNYHLRSAVSPLSIGGMIGAVYSANEIYILQRDGSEIITNFLVNKWDGTSWTTTNFVVPGASTYPGNPVTKFNVNPLSPLLKTSDAFYFTCTVDEGSGKVRFHMFRMDHDFTNVTNLGVMFATNTNQLQFCMPANVHLLSVGDSFHAFANQETTDPANAVNAGSIYIKKFTLLKQIL